MSDAPQQLPPSTPDQRSLSPRARFALEMGPLLIFFLTYKSFGIMAATATLVVVTLLSLAIIYLVERKLAAMPLVTGVMVSVFGTLTVLLDDETFVKMKPTIVNLIFSSVLLGGLLFKKPLLKVVLHYALQLQERGWWLLSLRWGIFFAFLAVLNEYIWRNYSTDFWVNFKVFGMLTCTLVFTFSQIPLMQRYMIHPEDGPDAEPDGEKIDGNS